MKLGYFTMPLHPPGSKWSNTLQNDLQQILLLDELGYDEAWIGEHFTAEWENIPAPDQFIAMALALTDNIKLGTGVTCMPNHNPFTIAHRIAQLDNLAKGRFQWGIGSGGFPGDFTVFGVDPSKGEHREITKKALDIILKIWDDPVPGKYKIGNWQFEIPVPNDNYGLRFHCMPYQKPHPPIAVAGVSQKSDTLLLAGQRGYIPMSINIVPFNTLGSHWDAVEEGAKSANVLPDRTKWRIARDIFVAETDEEARKYAKEGVLKRDYEQYFFQNMKQNKVFDLIKNNPDMSDNDVSIDYLIDNVWIVGSVETVIRKIEKLFHLVGGFGAMLIMGHEWLPEEKWKSCLELMAKEVVPALQKKGI